MGDAWRGLSLPGALPSTSLHRSHTARCLSFPYGAARGGRRIRVSWMSPARISQPELGASHRCCRPGHAWHLPLPTHHGGKCPKTVQGGSGPLILPPPASQHCQCPCDPKSTPNPFGHSMSITLSAGSGRCSTCRVVVPRSIPGPMVPPWMQAPGQAGDGRARPGCCGDVPAPLLTSNGGKSRPQSK